MASSPQKVDSNESPEGDSAADALRAIAPWEGESYEELVELFADVRQRTSRPVPDLDDSASDEVPGNALRRPPTG